MFCLFKNSRIAFPFNYLVLGISLFGVGYWLHFAFIEKAFLETVFSGQALFVDLLLGLPVVLIFALVVYALIFWGLKVVMILLTPQWIVQLDVPSSELSDQLDPALGDDYWQATSEKTSNEAKNEAKTPLEPKPSHSDAAVSDSPSKSVSKAEAESSKPSSQR